MKILKIILFILIAGLFGAIFASDYGNNLINSVINILGKTGVAAVLVPLITGIFGLIGLKLKSSAEDIKKEVKNISDKFDEKFTKTNEKIDSLKHEWEDIKNRKAVKLGYKKQLNNISSNLMTCFKINYDLKKFATMLSESIIDFSTDIQGNSQDDMDFDVISQKLTVISEMLRQAGYGVILDDEFIDNFFIKTFYNEMENFKSKIKFIIEDVHNDKCARFHKEVSKFLKQLLSELLTCWMQKNTK